MADNKVTYEIEIDSQGAVASVKKLDKEIKQVGKGVKEEGGFLGGLFSPTPINIATAAVAGLGVAIGFAAKKTMDFDKQMSAVKAITNASDEDFLKLRDTALKLGASTVFTATEAAEGLQFLGMAGFTAQQSIEALPGVLDLASSSGLELGRAADIASNILSQFQKPASETINVADLMAKTITTSNTNMEQMADAMNYLGPTAAAFKIPIEEVAATIGILSSNGLKGSLGTRALGTALVRLTKPTKQMKEVISSLNLDFFDQQGNFIGLIALTKQLETATAGMTDEQKQMALSTLFEAEAIQEMNILLSTGSTKLQEYTSELSDAEGAAKKMANTRLDNLAGDLTLLESAVEGLSIKLLEDKQGFFRSIVRGGTEAIEIIGDLITSTDKFNERTNKIEDDWLKGFKEIAKELSHFFSMESNFGVGLKNMGTDLSNFFSSFLPKTEKTTSIASNNGIFKDIKDGFGEIGSGFGFLWNELTGVTPANTKKIEEKAKKTEEPEKKKIDEKLDTNVEKVSSAKTTHLTVNINKLIDNFTVSTSTVNESTSKIRDMVVEVLLSAVNDVNLIAE